MHQLGFRVPTYRNLHTQMNIRCRSIDLYWEPLVFCFRRLQWGWVFLSGLYHLCASRSRCDLTEDDAAASLSAKGWTMRSRKSVDAYHPRSERGLSGLSCHMDHSWVISVNNLFVNNLFVGCLLYLAIYLVLLSHPICYIGSSTSFSTCYVPLLMKHSPCQVAVQRSLMGNIDRYIPIC